MKTSTGCPDTYDNDKREDVPFHRWADGKPAALVTTVDETDQEVIIAKLD
jgi:hypothetical protein